MPIGERGPSASYRPDDVVPSLHAFHQPGISTPVLDHLAFAALDVVTNRGDELHGLLGSPTETAVALMERHAGGRPEQPAGALTVTLGLGPGVFAARFGLAKRRPVALAPLPAFAKETHSSRRRAGRATCSASRTPPTTRAGAATSIATSGSAVASSASWSAGPSSSCGACGSTCRPGKRCHWASRKA